MRDERDYKMPENVADVLALLRRRIEVHRRWATFIRNQPQDAKAAVDAGVGTEESHERYAQQYEASIRAIERCS